MNHKAQMIAAWCGPGFIICMLIGWLIIGFLPPLAPGWSPETTAAFYQDNPIRIRLGLLFFMWATALYLPFAGVLTVQMMRIEGKMPVWSFAQVMASAGNVVTLTFPTLFWAVAAFRLDRSPELIQLANDLAWVPFVGMTSPFLIIPIAIAIVGFMDKSETPTFPRWACYYNIFVVLLLLPGGVITVFHDGPFAWDGVFGFWLPLTDWGIWFLITCILLMKGIKRQSAAARSAEYSSVDDSHRFIV